MYAMIFLMAFYDSLSIVVLALLVLMVKIQCLDV